MCNHRGERYTLIERAVELDSMEVTRVLILAKVDLNKTARTSYHMQGVLEIAFKRYSSNQPYANLNLVRMLLEDGALLNPERISGIASNTIF